jgi:hypothetical protein
MVELVLKQINNNDVAALEAVKRILALLEAE